MVKEKVILFLSDRNRYLQHDLYCQLASNTPGNLKTVFLASDFKPNPIYKFSQDQDNQELSDAFSQFIDMGKLDLDHSIITNPLRKLKRIYSNLRTKLAWRTDLLLLIDELKPSLIVLTTTNAENSRVLSRFRPSIPKLYIQPCNLRVKHSDSYSFLEATRNFWFNRILKLPILPVKETTFDHYGHLNLALWSDIWKSHARERSNSTFFFTGNPMYDQFFTRFQENRPNSEIPRVWIFLNKEKNNGRANWDLYANFYRELMNKQSDVLYNFKAHPHSDIESVQSAFPAAHVTKAPVSKDDVDIMITHWSTSALEFIAQGIPTILINPNGRFDLSERYLDHYQAVAEKPEDMIAFIEKYRKEGSSAFLGYRSDFVRRSLTADDGRSTERVVQLIQQLSEPA